MREVRLRWGTRRPFGILGILLVSGLLAFACAPAARPSASAPAAPSAPVVAEPTAPATETLDELYEKAREEGGTLSLYGSLNFGVAPKIFAAFEQRFPDLKVEWLDGTGDKLMARIISEARGGKVLADVLQTNIDNVAGLEAQGLLSPLGETLVPEAAAYSDFLKGPFWVSSDLKFLVAAWNTNLVSKDREPRQYEDFADPWWKNKLIADPNDAELLMGLAMHKYRSDEPAVDVLRRIAANNVEFHEGHARLIELLVAGQAAACLTCFSHNLPPQMSKGAPVDYWLTEGIARITANAVIKNAPHPNTALLWVRWVTSEEGQQVYAEAGSTPAHPNVQPVLKTRPERMYPFGVAELRELRRYDRLWKEVFQLR